MISAVLVMLVAVDHDKVHFSIITTIILEFRGSFNKGCSEDIIARVPRTVEVL